MVKQAKLYLGDNINLLNKMINEKTKMDLIYIDPPYNSKISLNYSDNFSDFDYFIFMRDRILKSVDILSDDGVLIIQIDENGFHTINKILEIFFHNTFKINIWDKLGPNYSAANDHKLVGKNKGVFRQSHEYIFILYKKLVLKKNLTLIEYEKIFLKNATEPQLSIWSNKQWTNVQAKKEVIQFQTPKPIELLKELFTLYSLPSHKKFLDIFAGSAQSYTAIKLMKNDFNVYLAEQSIDNYKLIKSKYKDIKCESISKVKMNFNLKKTYFKNNIKKWDIAKWCDKHDHLEEKVYDVLSIISIWSKIVLIPLFSQIERDFRKSNLFATQKDKTPLKQLLKKYLKKEDESMKTIYDFLDFFRDYRNSCLHDYSYSGEAFNELDNLYKEPFCLFKKFKNMFERCLSISKELKKYQKATYDLFLDTILRKDFINLIKYKDFKLN